MLSPSAASESSAFAGRASWPVNANPGKAHTARRVHGVDSSSAVALVNSARPSEVCIMSRSQPGISDVTVLAYSYMSTCTRRPADGLGPPRHPPLTYQLHDPVHVTCTCIATYRHHRTDAKSSRHRKITTDTERRHDAALMTRCSRVLIHECFYRHHQPVLLVT